MEHVDEDLPALLDGELTGVRTREVAAHLRECAECAEALIATAVAWGSLRAVVHAESGRASVTPAEPEPLVPLRRPTRWRVVAAAAAAVVLLAGVAAAVVRTTSGPPTVATAVLSRLEAPASASGRVTVTLTGRVDHMHLTTSGLPAASPGHFYEVWLLQPATLKMLPLGVLPPSGQGDFQVATSIMAHYSAVDVSLQADDGNPTHSKVSALRGTVTTL